MRTNIADTVNLAVEIAAEKDGFAQQDIALQRARLQVSAQRSEPPAVLEQTFAEGDAGGGRSGALIRHGVSQA